MSLDSDIFKKKSTTLNNAESEILFPKANILEVESVSDISTSDSGFDEVEGFLCHNYQSGKSSNGYTFNWEKRVSSSMNSSWKGSISSSPELTMEPLQYFKMYFSEDLFQMIARKSSLYAHHSNSLFQIDKEEIEIYIGILLKMSICPMSKYKLHWSEEMRFNAIADHITKNRFVEINKYLYYADSNRTLNKTQDRLRKIRPFLNHIRNVCIKINQEEEQHINEEVIPFKRVSLLHQDLPPKPVKLGFKIISRCGLSGMIYDFFIYDGKTPTVTDSTGFQPSDMVIKLCETLPKHMNFKLYLNNFYNFLELQVKLKAMGILTVGTIRQNRLRKCPLKSEKLLKKEGIGACDSVVDTNSGLVVTQWYDNKLVTLSSSHLGVEPLGVVKRWDGRAQKTIEISVPRVVLNYSQHVGVVDLFKRQIVLYKFERVHQKWHKRIFFWGLKLCVVNSWLLYKRHWNKQFGETSNNPLDLASFTTALSASLIQEGKSVLSLKKKQNKQKIADTGTQFYTSSKRMLVCTKKGRSLSIKNDGVGHFPKFVDARKQCKFCGSYITQMTCCKCNVHLCLQKERNCFIKYHKIC